MTLIIRDATRADLPRIVEIYNQSIPGRMATADTEVVTVAEREAWFDSHSPGARPLWVAQDGEHVVGFLSVKSFYGRPAYGATVELGLYVANDARQRGVGRALLSRLIERAPSLGITTLLGFIFGHNRPSLRLFAAQGFASWGNLPAIATLDGVRRDLVIVGRRVS